MSDGLVAAVSCLRVIPRARLFHSGLMKEILGRQMGL